MTGRDSLMAWTALIARISQPILQQPVYGFLSILPVVVITLFLAACATPQTASPEVESVAAEIEAKKQRALVIEASMEAEKRLQAIAYRLQTQGVALCGDKVAPKLGIWMWNGGAFEEEWRATLLAEYGVSDLVQVAFAAPGSPAAQAGLQVGDIPVSINGWHVPVGDDAMPQVRDRLDEFLKAEEPIRFRVRRDGRDVDLSAEPVPACDFDVALQNDDTKNAYADGKRIIVTRGMMDFFKSDEEVALVVAHELAHNAMGHISAKKQNAMVGGIFGLLLDVAAAASGVDTQGQFTDLGMKAGAGAYSVGFEQEADYVALYLMAQAGYEIDEAPKFWRRLAIQDPKSIALKTTHPTTPERFVAMEKAIEEIQAKITNGEPLEPEMKPETTKPAEVPEDYLESG